MFLQMESMKHVVFAYGIGFLGIYDFGTISPYMMVDNAIIIFTVLNTLILFKRAIVVRIFYVKLLHCMAEENMKNMFFNWHYVLFTVIPLSSELFQAHKLYLIHVYLTLITSTGSYIILATLTMSKLLHSEFGSVKNVYIVGLICFVGFGLSIAAAVFCTTPEILGIILGLDVTVLYLASFKVAAVMWLYGVKNFSNDINFWHGFKPTKYWTIIWILLPIIFGYFMVLRILIMLQRETLNKLIPAAMWIIISFAIVAGFQIKTIAKFIMRNNMAGVFKPTAKYGPLDFEDRKRRKTFNETLQLRQCKHNCNALDNMFECDHSPIKERTDSELVEKTESISSLTNIYDSRNKYLKKRSIL